MLVAIVLAPACVPFDGQEGTHTAGDANVVEVDASEEKVKSSATSPADDASWQTLRRSLENVDLAMTDGNCPRSVVTHEAGPGFSEVVGNGPVYLTAPGANASVSLSRSPHDDGWFLPKHLWIANASYRGPILIRGWMVDGDSPVKFAGYGSAHADGDTLELCGGYSCSDELRLPRGGGATSISQGTRHWGGYIAVKEQGCYAFQIDGETFTDVVVIQYIHPT